MSAAPPRRGEVTDALIDHLTETLAMVTVAGVTRPVLVGDSEAPTAGGWSEHGTPQRGVFIPYVTVATEAAMQRDPSPVAGSHASWILGYRLRTFGADRKQADWAADEARVACLALTQATITAGERWRITQVNFAQLGPVVPARGQIDPPAWQVIDTVGLWLDRHRLQT